MNNQRILHQKRVAVVQLTLVQNAITFGLAGTFAAIHGPAPDAGLINVGWTGVNQGIGINFGASFLLQRGRIYLSFNYGLAISPLLTNVWMMGISQIEYSVGVAFGLNSVDDFAGTSMAASVPQFLVTSGWIKNNVLKGGVVSAFMASTSIHLLRAQSSGIHSLVHYDRG